MSENIRGITFAEQSVTPADDAIVRRAMLGDGILSGCEITYSGSTLTMAVGYIIACGRSFQITTAQNWAVVDATSGFARLLATIDLTQTATETTFNQISFSIEYASAEDGFVDLEHEDINNSGTKYQIVVAVVSLGTGGITGIVSKLEKTEGGSGLSMKLLWENASPASSFAARTIAVDLSKYTMCCIEYNGDLTDPNFRTEIFPIGNTVWLHSEHNNRSGREVVISKESVAFRVGKFGAYNELMRENNGGCVPLKIYGIRGVL